MTTETELQSSLAKKRETQTLALQAVLGWKRQLWSRQAASQAPHFDKHLLFTSCTLFHRHPAPDREHRLR